MRFPPALTVPKDPPPIMSLEHVTVAMLDPVVIIAGATVLEIEEDEIVNVPALDDTALPDEFDPPVKSPVIAIEPLVIVMPRAVAALPPTMFPVMVTVADEDVTTRAFAADADPPVRFPFMVVVEVVADKTTASALAVPPPVRFPLIVMLLLAELIARQSVVPATILALIVLVPLAVNPPPATAVVPAVV